MKLDIWETTVVRQALLAAAESKRKSGKYSVNLKLEAAVLEKAASALLDGGLLEPT